MQTQITHHISCWLRGMLIGILICVAIDALFPSGKQPSETVITEHTDTVFCDRPVVVYDTLSRWETVYFPQKPDVKQVADTLSAPKTDIQPIVTDSAVLIPISSKVYTDDSTYRCQVSGYHATLDWIETYHKTIEINHPPNDRRSRFHIGLQGGYGVVRLDGRTGLGPYIGLGITVNF